MAEVDPMGKVKEKEKEKMKVPGCVISFYIQGSDLK